MRVRVALPGDEIVGELRGRADVRITFAPGRYRRYQERDLEEKLASLAKLLWAGRTREYYAAVSHAFGETVTGEPPPSGARDQAFVQARDELVAEGSSRDGRIRVTVRGMRRWQVRIADGTVHALDEFAFAERVREAAAALIEDQLAKVRVLKDQHYS
jgi:hypothetical protein